MSVQPRRSTLVLAMPALALGIIVAGCSGGNAPGSGMDSGTKTCTTDTQCSSDGTKVCVGGLCIAATVVSCADGGACPSGFMCNQLTTNCDALDSGATNPGNDGGTDNDATTGGSCSTKDDCPFGEACNGGVCGPLGNTTCTTGSTCERGQTCNFSMCTAGCDTSADCMSPATCSMSTYTCSSPAVSCASSSTCNASSPGTICTAAMTCGSCTQSTDCSHAPYGPNFTCGGGLCILGMTTDAGPNCTNTNCNGTNCLDLPGTCNQNSCTCEMADAGNCSSSNCGGTAAAPIACGAGQTCVNCATCEGGSTGGDGGIGGTSCMQNSDCPGANGYCAQLAGMGGTCTTSCTTSANCSSGVMCCSAAAFGIAACCDIDGFASLIPGLATCM